MTMFTALSFLLFALAMVLCLVLGYPSLWAIVTGLVAFVLSSLKEGWKPRQLWKMAVSELPKAWIVLRVMFFIGALTGLWRSSGTIAYIIYWSARIMSPRFFILFVFLITSMLSYLLGSSFAVCGTAGVILMVFARSGGVSIPLAAGAVLSGIYFGDRGAPTSSCLSLVSALTGTEVKDNVKRCFRTALPAYVAVLVLYTMLSLKNPLRAMDEGVLEALSTSFDLSYLTLLPALLMLVLPLFGLAIWKCMGISAFVSFLLTLFVQKATLPAALGYLVMGFEAEERIAVLSGGGIVSMWTTLLIIPTAAALTGILTGTGVLDKTKEIAGKLSGKVGRLGGMFLTSTLAGATFCSQAVCLMVSHAMLSDTYSDKAEMAMDMANTGVVVSGLVPWSVACSVPLSILGSGLDGLLYAFLLYLIPLFYFFTKRFHYRTR